MIPVKLSLRNFMSYRDKVPPLSFEGIHLACLCGDNGHGKSALLDAMTWALWGKSRAGSDDDLIHLGESEMEVELEFLAGGNRYRVLRKRTRSRPGRAGQPLLELQIALPSGKGQFRPITGNSLRETQAKIIDILHLDYETFINSAFLMQGRADEFTVKPPSQRKEVLADILGLRLYDRLEEQAREQARTIKNEMSGLESAISQIDLELARKEEYERELRERQQALSTLESEVEKQEEALGALRQDKKALEVKGERYRQIEIRRERIRQQVPGLEAEIKERGSRIGEYERTLAGYKEEWEKAQAQLANLALPWKGLRERRGQAEELVSRLHYLKSTNSRLRQEMAELKEKLNLLSRGDARCPLCLRELSQEGRERIMADYQAQGRERGDLYRANEGEAQQKERELKALRQEMENLERKITAERTQGERRLEALQRDQAQAERFLPQEREALKRAQEAQARWREAFEAEAQEEEALRKELEALPQLEEKLREVERSYRELRERQQASRDKLVQVQERLRRLGELEVAREEKAAALKEAATEKDLYDELVLAFGKKGIQALLIEMALPEMEEEANRLLGRMTDNRMHLRIETQRPYKSKKKEEPLEETLEIRISDELGTRSYEMFSGGEAFRINLALRIALSKLLAKRAGAPLPTLIIDEGFGTQDSQGRERLVEAITSIQEDFEKIIVVTHIEELRDLFPTRIEVSKTEEGSLFSVT